MNRKVTRAPFNWLPSKRVLKPRVRKMNSSQLQIQTLMSSNTMWKRWEGTYTMWIGCPAAFPTEKKTQANHHPSGFIIHVQMVFIISASIAVLESHDCKSQDDAIHTTFIALSSSKRSNSLQFACANCFLYKHRWLSQLFYNPMSRSSFFSIVLCLISDCIGEWILV